MKKKLRADQLFFSKLKKKKKNAGRTAPNISSEIIIEK